jgi:hypothetical protein
MMGCGGLQPLTAELQLFSFGEQASSRLHFEGGSHL